MTIAGKATAWVVDHYSDTLRERKIAFVEKQLEWDRQWKHTTIYVFDAESAAASFIIERSQKRVAEAEHKLKNQRRRLAKCLKKFGVLARVSEGSGA